MSHQKSDTQKIEFEALMKNYNGRLSLDQIFDGISTCIGNASDLVSDAQLLFDNHRYPRCVTISLCAMEELGKIQILQQMLQIPKDMQKKWKALWIQFRTHQQKNARGFTMSFDDALRTNQEAFFVATVQQAKVSPYVERVRQMGLYVDFHERDREWLSPKKEISKIAAEKRLEKASAAVNRIKHFQMIGLFDKDVLSIHNKIYADLHRNAPVSGDSHAKWKSFLLESKKAHFKFVKCLLSMGKITAESDFEFCGIPIRELESLEF